MRYFDDDDGIRDEEPDTPKAVELEEEYLNLQLPTGSSPEIRDMNTKLIAFLLCNGICVCDDGCADVPRMHSYTLFVTDFLTEFPNVRVLVDYINNHISFILEDPKLPDFAEEDIDPRASRCREWKEFHEKMRQAKNIAAQVDTQDSDGFYIGVSRPSRPGSANFLFRGHYRSIFNKSGNVISLATLKKWRAKINTKIKNRKMRRSFV